MKLKYIALALLCVSSVAYADEPQVTEIVIVPDNQIVGDKGDILEIVQLDSQPQFPGGIDGLMQWLGQNICYPEQCAENNIEGKVLVKFTVFKDGSVGNVEIVKSVHPLLDAEAERVVMALPKWTPGVLDGENVNVWYTLPINFKLQGDPREAESQQFVNLGNEALAQNNTAHAYAYYKEAFDILPTQFNLIAKCDSLLAGDTTKQIDFYKWAVGRLMREAQKDQVRANDYLANAISLQEKVVTANPNDLDELIAMEILYSYASDHSNVVSTAARIYSLLPSNEFDTLVDAMALDSASRFCLNDFNGVVNLVSPKLDLLFSSANPNKRVDPQLDLADAYIMLGKYKDAKKIIDRVKSFVPDIFDIIVEHHADNSPETHAKFVELAK